MMIGRHGLGEPVYLSHSPDWLFRLPCSLVSVIPAYTRWSTKPYSFVCGAVRKFTTAPSPFGKVYAQYLQRRIGMSARIHCGITGSTVQ